MTQRQVSAAISSSSSSIGLLKIAAPAFLKQSMSKLVTRPEKCGESGKVIPRKFHLLVDLRDKSVELVNVHKDCEPQPVLMLMLQNLREFTFFWSCDHNYSAPVDYITVC